MTEKVFETSVIKKFRKYKVYTEKMDVPSIPGIPDLLCLYRNKCIRVELKVIKNIRDLLKNVFEVTQPAYYVHYLTESNSTNLFLLVLNEQESCFEYMKISYEIALKLPDLRYSDIQKFMLREKDISAIIKLLKGEFFNDPY